MRSSRSTVDLALAIPYAGVLLLIVLVAAMTGCVDRGSEPPSGWHGPTGEELHTVGLPVTCSPHLEYYPIGGPHNGGWDSNATTFTCPDHPGSSPDNSDFIGGDHFGNDLFAVEGTPAIAVVSGTIYNSGYSGIGGNRVTITDSCGWHYYSAHLETIAPGITAGATVTAGQQIGTVGDTGNAAGTQAHIHFSIYPESYNAGIDPFALLQGVDSGSCSGDGSWSEGDTPDPGFNPCTDANVAVSEEDNAFAITTGSVESAVEEGRSEGGSFVVAGSFSGADSLTVGKWQPYVPHPGSWALDVYVPDTPFEASAYAMYDVAFQGGHAIELVDQEANAGSWVPLFGGQPFKFMSGGRGYVTLNNLGTITDGKPVAFDSLRWRYIGPPSGGGIGASCELSVDCTGELICGPADTCQQECQDTGCDSSESCDIATGSCVAPFAGDGDLLDEAAVDTDGDGVPNYLEGDGDADGDGIQNSWDTDSDNDGVPDSAEGSGDADGDGLMDSQDVDSDGDGILDGDEAGSWPDDPIDSDLDGTPDFQDADSDNDGIPDAIEGDTDSDGDGLPDYVDTDSDNDGISDAFEAGLFAEEPRDTDGDGTPDYLDHDSDDDGLTDSWEGTDDSDGDHVPDFRDSDSDNDGIPDASDLDSDGDGVNDDPDWLETRDVRGNDWAYGCSCDASDAAPGAGLGWLLLLGVVGLRRRANRA